MRKTCFLLLQLQDVPSASEKDFRKEYSYFDYPIEGVCDTDNLGGKVYEEVACETNRPYLVCKAL